MLEDLRQGTHIKPATLIYRGWPYTPLKEGNKSPNLMNDSTRPKRSAFDPDTNAQQENEHQRRSSSRRIIIDESLRYATPEFGSDTDKENSETVVEPIHPHEGERKTMNQHSGENSTQLSTTEMDIIDERYGRGIPILRSGRSPHLLIIT